MAATTRDLEVPASAMVTGSELMVVTRWQARAWEQVIASTSAKDPAPPLGWNPDGAHGAPVGYDLVLATPRTLSALSWCMFGADRGLSDEIYEAHASAAQSAAVEFSTVVGAEGRGWWAMRSTPKASRGRTGTWSMARWPARSSRDGRDHNAPARCGGRSISGR